MLTIAFFNADSQPRTHASSYLILSSVTS